MFGEALHRSTSFPCQTTPKLIESSIGGIIDNSPGYNCILVLVIVISIVEATF